MIRLTQHRTNKYGAKKTIVGGIKFDSKMEASYHQVLLNMQHAGLITELRLQPKFLLLDAFTKRGKHHQAIHYVGDFEYRDKLGNLVVIDVKGTETKEFQLKRKMFDARYPDIELRVVTLYNGQWVTIEGKKQMESEHKQALNRLTKRASKQNERRQIKL